MKKAIVPAIILALFAGLNCDLFKIPTNGGGGDDDWQPLTTPRGVIENIQWCYNNASIEWYVILLDEDNFVFYFAPKDVQDHGLPFSWTYDQEFDATDALFEAVGATNINLSLTFDEDIETEPNPDDTTFTIDGVTYSLRVYTPDTISQADAHANFELNRFVDGDGLMRWWLTKWWDIT